MTRRQMYQRGEEQNKPTGFWGMIKSVTSSPSGSESILKEPVHLRQQADSTGPELVIQPHVEETQQLENY